MATIQLESAQKQSLISEPISPAKRRLFYIDNLRTALITGIVLGHLSVTYGFDADWTYFEKGEVYPAFILTQLFVVAIGISFALPLFFMIAGYFTVPAYDHKGPRQFLVDRLTRLGIPWLIFEIFINPFIHYAVDVHGGECKGALYDCQYQGTFWQYLKDFPRVSGSLGDGPVWFLEALLIFSFFYALWRIMADWVSPGIHRNEARSYAIPSNGVIALFSLGIGLITFVIRIRYQAFVQYEPLHLEFARLPQYIGLFVAGLWAYRGKWFTEFSDHQAKTWLWVAIGCMLILPILLMAYGAFSGALDERATGGANWLSLSYSLWEGFMGISMVITVLTWFRRSFDSQGGLAQVMSQTSFAVYVIHPGIIVPLALALSDIHMNLSLKFLIVAPFAVFLCYLVAYALLKIPVLKSIFS